jgi:endonuclease/exonuclease/phosphatase family metal-dependent hydrolase
MNLRAVTLNFWGDQPPLDRRLALAVRQLAGLAPDVVGMQEVKPIPDAGRTTAEHLAAALGMTVVHGEAMPAYQEGLAILSRFPVLEHRILPLPEARPSEARILLSARLDTPAGPIWFHTTHLHYRLDDGVARERQVCAIDAAIRALGREPTDAPQILCGDFNATPDADEMRFLRGLTTLEGRRTHWQDAWLRLHPDAPGITWSSENEHTRPLRSLDLDRRIDYVLVTSRKKDGRGTVHRCEVVLAERDGEGRDAICASDHYAVLAEVQIAASV